MVWRQNNVRSINSITLLSLSACLYVNCGIYSFQGTATAAKTIEIVDFYNNADLAPANLGQTFSNELKDYYQKNSGLKVVKVDGELYIEGAISNYKVAARAPVSSGESIPDVAALSRLEVQVTVSYRDSIEPKNSFKNKKFSFYEDFSNTEDFASVQEKLEKKIFKQIMLDIFNATIANW